MTASKFEALAPIGQVDLENKKQQRNKIGHVKSQNSFSESRAVESNLLSISVSQVNAMFQQHPSEHAN